MFPYILILIITLVLFRHLSTPESERKSIFHSIAVALDKESAVPFVPTSLSFVVLLFGGLAMTILYSATRDQSIPQSSSSSLPAGSSPDPVSKEVHTLSSGSNLNFRTEEGCSQLGSIAANAFDTKSQGHSLAAVLQQLGRLDISDAQRKSAAEGVVIAIYGDSSLKTRQQAYQIAYSACKG